MAMQYLNVPYKWGSNGPFDFDCSGLAIKVLHDSGITIPDDSAEGLRQWATKRFGECEAGSDCLLFFGKDGKANHVAIGVSATHMIEAGGAGEDSLKMDLKQLGLKDARVRIKPIANRRDLISAVKIIY